MPRNDGSGGAYCQPGRKAGSVRRNAGKTSGSKARRANSRRSG